MRCMKSFMHIHTESDSETDDVADDASHADVTKPRPHMLSTTTTNSTSDSAPAPVMLPGESADNTPRCQFGAATVAWRVSCYTPYILCLEHADDWTCSCGHKIADGRYDMIRDAILTCARKPTPVGLIYQKTKR